MKKKFLLLTILAVIVSNTSYAVLETSRIRGGGGFTPIRVCVIPGAPALPDTFDVYGINLGCFYSFTYKKQVVYGFDLGIITESNAKGAQFAFINVGEKSDGVQIAFANATKEFGGIQFGVFNDAKNSNVLQFGLINMADSETKGIQFGLANLMENGIFWIMPIVNFSF